jgi:hypothetical protein
MAMLPGAANRQATLTWAEGRVLTLQAGSHREGSGASPGPVSTMSAGQTGHFRL